MKKEFIINLKGKDYPQYGGILDEAHEHGLVSISTDLVQVPTADNENVAIVKAVVKMKDYKVFEGYGDASPKNVNSFITTALIRMAETRAKGRALRDAINCGMTMLEELPSEKQDEVVEVLPDTSKPPFPNQEEEAFGGLLSKDGAIREINGLTNLTAWKEYGEVIAGFKDAFSPASLGVIRGAYKNKGEQLQAVATKEMNAEEKEAKK